MDKKIKQFQQWLEIEIANCDTCFFAALTTHARDLIEWRKQALKECKERFENDFN